MEENYEMSEDMNEPQQEYVEPVEVDMENEKEVLGTIFSINIEGKCNGDENHLIPSLHMSINVFNVDGDIIDDTHIITSIPVSNIKFIANGETKDWLLGIVEYKYISGLNGFVGDMVNVKYKGETISEITFLDRGGKIVIDGNDKNIDYPIRWGYNKLKLNLVSVGLDDFNTNGSCRISEFPSITGNEIISLVGKPLEGKFDKIEYLWHIKMDVEDVDSDRTASYLYTLYDYKCYGDINLDKPYPYHIGCGWKIDGVDIDDNKMCNRFRAYLYNKCLKYRNEQCLE